MIEIIKLPRFIVLSLLVLFAAASRTLPLFIPELGNFTAIGAIAIFAGAQFKDNCSAFLVPLVALALADLFIGNGFNFIVYGGVILMVGCGTMIRKNINLSSVAFSSLAGALSFYLITNFAYFYPQNLYPHNLAGIFTSYKMALPFLRNMLLGDIFYGFCLFGGFYLLEKNYPVLVIQ